MAVHQEAAFRLSVRGGTIMSISNGLQAMLQSSIKTGKRGRAVLGFTLIEVLVAFLILAVFLGVLYQTFSSGLKGAGKAEEYSSAVMQAESLLAEIGISIPLSEGDALGEFPDGHRWRVAAAPVAQTEQVLKGGPVAYDVTVEVFWGAVGKEQTVRLKTIKWGKQP